MITRRRMLALLAGSAPRAFAQGVSSRGVKPQPRGMPSGRPFLARFTDVAEKAGLTHPVVYGGIDTSAKWMATCSEMHAYTVGVASTGTLHVEPALQYFDGQRPAERIQSIDDSTLVLPPQPRLPPQPQR